MNTIQQITNSFADYIHKQFDISVYLGQNGADLMLNSDPLKQQFGDLNSNICLILAKELKKRPQEIAQQIIDTFTHPLVDRIEIAGAGFLNFFLKQEAFISLAQEMLSQKEAFFKGMVPSTDKYNIEFVSANPTGPLHFGHGRGGIIGDVLANVLSFLGMKVSKEFYINDAGSQMQKLSLSLLIRCQQALGIEAQLPEDGYHGEYLKVLAEKCINEQGRTVLEKSEDFFQEYAKEHMLKNIRLTLKKYKIEFDSWFSEKTLHNDGQIEVAIEILTRKGLIYEHEGALWFKSTEFGDDKDRVVKKATGEWTYVAADIAYLKNKYDRGFNRFVMILGHDHHSYAMRLQAVRAALDLPIKLDVYLYQLVKMKESGIEVRMSKRAGRMVYLDDVIEAVGPDVARFFYLHRKADAQLDFDVDLALKQSEENPVYYVQYAYVRIKSILQKIAEIDSKLVRVSIEDAQFLTPADHLLIKKIVSLQALLQGIKMHGQTHVLTYYVVELANLFHAYYGQTRVYEANDLKTTRARILLMIVLSNTFGLIFELLGVTKIDRM